jgi:glutamyl-Q tRNA(Asp) synthetase
LKPRSGASAAKSNTATATTAIGEAGGVSSAYVGRFAPTPSGELHLGSLYAAVASYLDARSQGGRWLLRIEDLDWRREVPGAADRILATLETFGFEWDGPVVRQRSRAALYDQALARLRAQALLFDCSCSRRELEDTERYPGTCRLGPKDPSAATGRRLLVEPRQVRFADRIQGQFRQDVAAAVGDFLLQRRDGIVAYCLAVVVDDAEQGVTDVVRGADLLDDTPRQIYLQQALGLPTPNYAHVPVLTEPDGAKLAKSRRSVPLQGALRDTQLRTSFAMLGMIPPDDFGRGSLAELWRWGIENWRAGLVPKCLSAPLSEALSLPK